MTDTDMYLNALAHAAKVVTPLAKDLVPYLLGTGELPEWFKKVPSPTRSRLALAAREAKLAVKTGK